MTPSTALAAVVLLVCSLPSGATKASKMPEGMSVKTCQARVDSNDWWKAACEGKGVSKADCDEARDNTRKWCRCEAH